MPDTHQITQAPYSITGADRPADWIVTCDHASNFVPDEFGNSLGLPMTEMERHIAYDPGAAGVAHSLAEKLKAPLIETCFSRLVVDPNRGEDDPTVLMKLYDGTVIPTNRHADAAEKERRLARYHRPYHDAYAKLVASRKNPVILAIHSFTPQLQDQAPRPWHIGLLFADDRRLADPLAEIIAAEQDICLGLNEPYGGHLIGDAIDRHALAHGHLNILIELRNDIIRTDAQQQAWATRLTPMLESAMQIAMK